MARQLIDLPRMNAEDLEDDDLLLIRDVSAKKDKRIKVQDLGAGGGGGGGVDMNDVFPVGSVRIFADNLDHSSDYGMTWVRYAQGKTLVGIDSSDTDFDTIGETGGSKTHQHNLSDNGYALIIIKGNGSVRYREKAVTAWTDNYYTSGGSAGSSSDSQGYGAVLRGKTDSANGMPPYITVSFWRRTA